ncbi:MAG TPA: tetratricopeptide repeat protein [Terriglobia bacterium]|nr:tetratricopeptide repeat protein [Terriglobia bacterium]
MQSYESKRGLQRCGILLLASLCVWLQGRQVSAQTAPSDHNQSVPAGLGPVSPKPAVGEQGTLESPSQVTENERYRKALADFRAGKLDEAAGELRSLNSARARNALGVVLESSGDHPGALAAFQDALRVQPDFEEAAHNATKLLIREGRPRAAIAQLQSTLESIGKSIENRSDTTFSLQMLLVEAYASIEQDKPAAELLEKLLTEKPDSAEVRLKLAISYAHLGSLDAAVGQYREALRLNSENGTALMGLAKTLLQLKRGSEATPYLQEYIRLRPNDADGYDVLGCDFRDAGRFKEAAAEFAQAARISPEDYDIQYKLGMALWRAGELDTALSQLEAAERLKPDEVQVHVGLARVLRSLGREERATKESELSERLSLRKTRDREAGLHITNGSLLLNSGDFRGAAAEFRQALELDPESAPARSDLGLVLARQNDPQSAEQELKKAIALDPKLVLAYNALGTVYMEEGHVSEGKEAFQQAIRIDPQYAEAKNNLGTLYAKLGKSADAISLFEEAVEDSPQYSQAYLNWGLVLASQGNLTEAKPLFEKALHLSPNLAEARKALQMVEGTRKGQD